MGNLDDILKKKVESLGIERQVEAVGVVEKATEEIAKFIPREDFEVVSFNRGILKIKTVSSSVSSEISLNSEKLMSISRIKKLVIIY